MVYTKRKLYAKRETEVTKKFNKCSCFLYIGKNRLRKIIKSSGYYKDRPKPKKPRYEYQDYYEEMFEETTF